MTEKLFSIARLNQLLAFYFGFLAYLSTDLLNYHLSPYSWSHTALFLTYPFLLSAFGLLLLNRFLQAAYGILFLYLIFLNHTFPKVKEIQFGFLGWLLLFLMLTSILKKEDKNCRRLLKGLFFLCMGGFYSSLGYLKLQSPDWLSGDILYVFLQWNQHKDSWFWNIFNEGIFKIISTGLAWAQFSSIFFIFSIWGRWWIWLVTTVMHISIACLSEYHHVSSGMLIFQYMGLLFLLDINPTLILSKVKLEELHTGR